MNNFNNIEETKVLTAQEIRKACDDSIKDETIDTYADNVLNAIVEVLER